MPADDKPQGVLIGLDVGHRRVGVAVFDPEAGFPLPLTALERKHAAKSVAELCDERAATAVVVGWPLEMDGREGKAARRTQRFVDELVAAFEEAGLLVDVVKQDERLTSMEAERLLSQGGVGGRQRRDHIDAAAAGRILDAYVGASGGDE